MRKLSEPTAQEKLQLHRDVGRAITAALAHVAAESERNGATEDLLAGATAAATLQVIGVLNELIERHTFPSSDPSPNAGYL
jgi:hypothetical protein